MTATPLTDALRAGVGDDAELPGDLEARLAELVVAAASAWPDLEIASEPFLAYVGEHLPRDAVDAALGDVCASDLYLACGCAAGGRQALAAFDRTYRATALALAQRVGSPALAAEDAVQRVWQKLFVGDSARPPGIASYGGRGALASWVRATMVRTLIDIHREARRTSNEIAVDDETLWGLPATAGDPEIHLLKTTYLTEFRDAFARAIAALTPRQRNLLRQHFVHALTIDQLGALYRVHRATAARQLATARETLLRETRNQLGRHLEIGRAEVDSILRLIESRLDLSLRHFLGSVVTAVEAPDD